MAYVIVRPCVEVVLLPDGCAAPPVGLTSGHEA